MEAAAEFGLPSKRSVTIAGHETSVSLEPVFWMALERAAAERAIPLNALIARIDAERIRAPRPPNLTSALRQWLLLRALGGPADRPGEGGTTIKGVRQE